MNLETFRTKLLKLNKNLWVDTSRLDLSTQQVGIACGIYILGLRAEPIKGDGLDSELVKMTDKFNTRPMIYLGWVNSGRIYEGDRFLSNGRVDTLGWRSLIKRLLEKGITTKEKAYKSFGYTESFYDKLDYHGKLEFYKKHELN